MSAADDGPALGSADGRTPAFADIVREHWDAVRRLLYSLSADAHATDDLAQETFLRALDRIGTFRAGSNLRAWILRVASNVFFDEHRRRKRTRAEALTGDAPDPAGPVGGALETSERGRLLTAAMAELSDLTRLVFHLRAAEDLSFREIAGLAGTTEQAARWHMHQARTKLLAKLGEDF